MIRPGIVLNRLRSVHSLKIGAAIAIPGNVVIVRISARIQNFPGRRASAEVHTRSFPFELQAA